MLAVLKLKLQKTQIAHTSWGAHHSFFLTIYHSVIHSKLDYGSVVCGCARKSYITTLELIATAALQYIPNLLLPPEG